MNHAMHVTLAVLAGLLLAGCGGDETEPEAPAEPTGVRQAPAGSELEAARQQAEATAEAVAAEAKAAKDRAAAEAAKLQAEAEAQAQAAQDQFTAMLADIRSQIEAEAYQAALKKIQAALQLPDLTDAQKQTLQGLLATVKEALAGDAAKQTEQAIGGALKGLGQ